MKHPTCLTQTDLFPFKYRTDNRYRLLLAACAVSLAALRSFGASQTWTNAPVDATWPNTNNWVARGIPGALNLTGNSVNNDIVTINTPIPGSLIGSAANPILTDDATVVADRSRQIGGITFDTANVGAYVISNTSPAALATASTPETGILNVNHNNSIQMTASVTNSQRIMVPLFTRLPSSTAGVYSFINNSTNAATLYINSATNDSANTRGTVFTLDGSNTGTNTIGALSAGATTSGANGLTKQGNGTWILAGPNDFRAQTVVQVVAGKLIVNDIAAFNGATGVTATNTGILQLNGITLNQASLNLTKGGTIRVNGIGGVNGLTVGAQSGTSVTVDTANASDVFTVGSGLTITSILAGGAADSVLNTTGPGTFIFGQGGSQANTYAGRWNFAAKTNQLNASSALSTGANANVAAGATLDLTPLGATTFTPTTSGMGGSGTGTTVGSTAAAVLADPAATVDLTGKAVNLTFTPTSASGDTTHPALYIAQGTLALSGSGNTFFVNNASGSALGVGTYRLIQQASGSVTAGSGHAVIVSGSGLAGGTTAAIQVSGGNVDLVVSVYVPKNLVWKGGNPDATWNVNGSANFLNGATPSVFNNSDNVAFDSTGSANPTVTLSGTLAPNSVTVDTSANNYAFAGSGQVAGTTSLLKTGAGTLQLQTVNTYAGNTVVSNGVIQYGIASAISSTGNGDVGLYGGGSLDLNNFNGTINGLNGNGSVDNTGGSASVLTVGNNDRGGTFTGLLKNTSGTLGISKIGTNIEVLSASNSYSGPTTVSAGTLATVNDHALGSGDLTLNAVGNLDVRTTQLFLDSLAGTGGSIVNATTSTTNRIIITGTNTTTFAGVIGDGAGGGGMALTLLGGSLTMSGGNTYSGGTIVGSSATFAIANGPAGVIGGLIASNASTLALSGGSATPATPGSVTTVDGASVTLTAGAEGKIWTGQFIGSATATNRFITSGTGISAGGTLSFSNFLGLVQIAVGTANFRFFNDGGVSGGDNTVFELDSGNIHVRGSTLDPQTVYLGALLGGSNTFGIGGSATTNAMPTTWIIGGKGLDTVFHGYINGNTNNLVKSGTGRFTLDGLGIATNTDSATYTNYLYSPIITYPGTTTVSNGVLALICPNDFSNSPSITLAAPTAVLDASQMGYVSNFTDVNGANSVLITNGILHVHSGQSVGGVGTIRGNVQADAGSVVAPGLTTGVLTVTNGIVMNGAINMNLNRTLAPRASEIAAPSIDVTGATITVTNLGPDLITGDSFQLFSVPVSGTPAAVNLPTTFASGTYVWTNKLAIDGTVQVLSGATPPNPTPTSLITVVSGSSLNFSWPADHTGWSLQTNAGSLINGTWYTYPGSTTTNAISIPISVSTSNVFYRMQLTP
jgi:autotransporter-associated beta strand protein